LRSQLHIQEEQQMATGKKVPSCYVAGSF